MESVCHYSTLGVDASASAQEITAAYSALLARVKRRLAAGNPLPLEQLDALTQAYRTLSCLELRQAYDDARAPTAKSTSVRGEFSEAPDAAAITADTAPDVPVEFRGSGEEYFRIWLVNIALTLVTLGLYSPWAKVRREKYFHRNMLVAGSAFDYHGQPRAILFGRIVLVLFFLLSSVAENIGTSAKLGVLLLATAVFPWLLVQSMRFRARNTSYRGIRFSFTGTYRQVLVLFFVHGGLSFLTLGLYFPAFLQKQKAFVANHLSYGDAPVRFSAGIGAFYRKMALPLALWMLALAGVIGVAAALVAGGKLKGVLALTLLALPLLGLLIAFLQLLLLPYARVVGSNLLWNHMTVGHSSFRSTQRVRSYLGIIVGNWALTLLTLGFFWPLGQIRLARFRARNLNVSSPQTLAQVANDRPHAPSALGSEAMAALDFDIAL